MKIASRPYFTTPTVEAAYHKLSKKDRKRVLDAAHDRAIKGMCEFDIDPWLFAVSEEDFRVVQ